MSPLLDLSEAEMEAYEERAAIMEFDGGLSRADAECRALDEVLAARESKA